MKKKLFVLSMDAMVREDIAYLKTKPNFKKIMEKRAEVDKVLTVYPASTYPAHTTLMTGAHPGRHARRGCRTDTSEHIQGSHRRRS